MTGHMSALDAQQQRQSARASVPKADAAPTAPGKAKGLSAAASRSYSVVSTILFILHVNRHRCAHNILCRLNATSADE